MSMTREEASVLLKMMFAFWANTHERTNVEMEMALNLAISALRPVSRERIEKVWSGCYMCDEYRYFMFNAWKDPLSSKQPDCMGTSIFCPHCGRPLTDEAVQMVMERLEELHDNRT